MGIVKLNLEDVHFSLNVSQKCGELSYTVDVDEFHDPSLFIDGSLIIEEQNIELEFDGYSIITSASISITSSGDVHYINVYDLDDDFIITELREILDLSSYWEINESNTTL